VIFDRIPNTKNRRLAVTGSTPFAGYAEANVLILFNSLPETNPQTGTALRHPKAQQKL
jgi:hypothetical protein